ncbi:MAG: TonB-dependent receptor [Gammaproteobacteria bacterium]|nr:TonB-dependent receptor [Gammaproteobacteria bacterium]
MKKIMRYSILPLCASIVSTSFAAPVLEEVIVTAEKRENTLQDTPIAITAFTADQISKDRVHDYQEIALKTPNMVYVQLGGFSQIYLRGVGLNVTSISGDPAVATYVDGVYQGATFAQNAPVFDLERIEVLRGPQGTLYGRNATGGSFNLITKTPHQDVEYNAAVTFEDYEKYTVEMGANVPISSSAALRGSFTYLDQGEGYRENPIRGEDMDAEENISGRAALLLQPTDNFEMLFRGEYSDHERTGAESELLTDAFNRPQFTPFISDPDDLTYTSNSPKLIETEIKGFSATLTWDITDSIQLKSITGWRDSDWDELGDNDGTPLTLTASDSFQYNEQFTQEINLSGVSFGDRLNWIMGVYYLQDDSDTEFTFDATDLIGLGFSFAIEQEAKAYAGFAQGTYDINDQFAITGGARYTRDEKEVGHQITFGIPICGDFGVTTTITSDEQSWDDVTWTAGLDYKLNNDTLLFAKASTGYRSGGYNLGACGLSFDPETIDAYEIGAKTQLFDNRLQLNASFFKYDYTDIQILRLVSGTTAIDNASSADILGFELEYIGLVTDNIRIDGSVSYLDTEYGSTVFGNPLVPTNEFNIGGNNLVNSPEWSATAGIEFVWPAFNGDVTLRWDMSYKDNYYFDVFNASLPSQSELEQDSFVITNARLGWESSNSTWGILAFVDNITDELYRESASANGLRQFVGANFSRPLTFGVRLSYSYQ